MRRGVFGALLLLAPAVASAQTPPPLGDGIPAGYFTRAAKTWTFSGCGTGAAIWNGFTWSAVEANAVCTQGRISLGQFANGNYSL